METTLHRAILMQARQVLESVGLILGRVTPSREEVSREEVSVRALVKQQHKRQVLELLLPRQLRQRLLLELRAGVQVL